MGKDKITHLIYSAIGAFLLSVAAMIVLHTPEMISGLIGFGSMLFVGLYKEFVHDKWQKKGQFELADLLADVAGCGIGVIVFLLIF